MSLVPVDTSNALAVSDYLDKAKQWLHTAVEMTGPAEIAMAKAEIATAAEATKQLGLSKDIQLDAQEMVRRAEYALGKAIRRGQAEGTVMTKADGAAIRDGILSPEEDKVSPRSFYGPTRAEGSKAYQDGNALASVDPETFDQAVDEAKAEGNLSRANVVRKVRKARSQDSGGKSRAEKADLLEELAAQGFSSRQMCKALDYSRDDQVRELAREYGIEIPADKAIGRTRRIDSTRIVTQTATALEGLAMGVELIDFASLDLTEAGQWTDSLSDSLRALNRFHKQLKETIQ